MTNLKDLGINVKKVMQVDANTTGVLLGMTEWLGANASKDDDTIWRIETVDDLVFEHQRIIDDLIDQYLVGLINRLKYSLDLGNTGWTLEDLLIDDDANTMTLVLNDSNSLDYKLTFKTDVFIQNEIEIVNKLITIIKNTNLRIYNMDTGYFDYDLETSDVESHNYFYSQLWEDLKGKVIEPLD